MAVLLNKADLISKAAVEELAAWYKENCRADQVQQGLLCATFSIDAPLDNACMRGTVHRSQKPKALHASSAALALQSGGSPLLAWVLWRWVASTLAGVFFERNS